MSLERKVKRQFPPVPEHPPEGEKFDIYSAQQARAQRVREAMVAVEETRLLAIEVNECYKNEGVNHYRNCEEATRAYVARILQAGASSRPVEMSDVDA